MKNSSWKEALRGRIEPALAHDIDVFEGQLELKRQGNLDDRVFAETRLRRGVYGQRYDNGQRHDGTATRALTYPTELLKGPDTLWDAPGMQRIKVPYGGITPDQMEVLAEVAKEYSTGVLHVTTRQDFQIHYVHIEDTPDLMRRLGSVGITTQEACGNVIRNVTGCPLAGVCRGESFDVTPYSRALARFMLGHDDAQDFGRKFKIAFSGCESEACGLVKMHDLGFLARTRTIGSVEEKGFAVYVGGGLGTIPHQAKLLSPFVPEGEILPLTQAICRVFASLGEKRNRNRARIKFLVAGLGIDEFRRRVFEERHVLPADDRWTAYLGDLGETDEAPAHPPVPLNGQARPEGFERWYAANTYRQRQDGYYVATVHLPLGDITSDQIVALADIARRYAGDNVRTTVEQNVVLRWIAAGDLPDLYRDLSAVGLGEAGAGTIVDITSCPGTDTCKLGIASSRGLAGELRLRLAARSATLPEAIANLKIKISGCFNSCGQHHVADIGFYGNSRKAGNHKVPHFQVVLGGQWDDNAGSYGLAVGAVPSKSVPDVVDVITNRYVEERQRGEGFKDWVVRIGKQEAREIIRPLMEIPDYEVRPDFYSDWGDPREFTLGDLGKGECAGEVVSLFSMEIAKADSEAFEAQVAIERGNYSRADELAYSAMLLSARSLIRTQCPDVGIDSDEIVDEFTTRFVESQLFFDRYARGKFAQYLIDRHQNPPEDPDEDHARRVVEEAQLFIEAAHACDMRINEVRPEKVEGSAPVDPARLPPRAATVASSRRPTLPPGSARRDSDK